MKEVAVRYRSERTFVLQIEEDNLGSDHEHLLSSFLHFAKSDAYFTKKFKEHFAVFQYYDTKFEEQTEVNSTTKIYDGQKLSLHFIPIVSPEKAQLNNHDAPAPQAVADTQPIVIETDDMQTPQDKTLATTKRPLQFELDESEVNAVENACKAKRRKSDSPTREPKFQVLNFPLPSLPKDVLDVIEANRIHLNSSKFVRCASEHLLTLIERPIQSEYENYVDALFLAHPKLVFINEPQTDSKRVLRKKLSQCVRNTRRSETRKVPDELRKRGCSIKNSEPILMTTAKEVSNSPNSEYSGEGTASSDPLSHFKDGKVHPSALFSNLTETLPLLKLELEKFDKLTDAFLKFPALANTTVISSFLFELAEVEEKTFHINCANMFQRLSFLFGVPKNTDEDKLICLQSLESHLHNALYKNYPRSISVEKIGGEKPPKTPDEYKSNAPITLNYVNSKSAITKVHLMGDNISLFSNDKLCPHEVVSLLMGVYYTFNRHYPEVSKHFLTALQVILLQKNAPKSMKKVYNFLKVYNDVNAKPLVK